MLDNQFEIIDEKKNRGFMLLVALACFLSNISQLPFLVSAGMTQKLNMPMWIVLLLYIFLKKRLEYSIVHLRYFLPYVVYSY